MRCGRNRWWALAWAGMLLSGVAPPAFAETLEELKQRLIELENTTRQQIEGLKRLIQERGAQREREIRAFEEQKQRDLQVLKEQLEQQKTALKKQEEGQARWGTQSVAEFFDLEAGQKQTSEGPPLLGKDIKGNVYSSDQFKVRFGGSFRGHFQGLSTPVGEAIGAAPRPRGTDPEVENRNAFRAFAGRTRLNLAIQGPDTLGGKTAGFFEFDFNRILQTGPGAALNPNPRLRHAFGQWTFGDVFTKADSWRFRSGNVISFADNVADTVDFNTLLGGLGSAFRRNVRIESVYYYPLTESRKTLGLVAFGIERPFFDSDAGLGSSGDLSGGEFSRFPALSFGTGIETGPLRPGFSWQKATFYVRGTWGNWKERFSPAGSTTPVITASGNFTEQTFVNWAAHGAFELDRIGWNTKDRAMTFRLKGGGVWSKGDAFHLNAEFGRRIFVTTSGMLDEAESYGGFINPQFWFTNTLSLRWAGGIQLALDSDRPTIAPGVMFPKQQNYQSEVSVWWTPGPFTFALAYNFTQTRFKNVPLTGPTAQQRGEVHKIEAITWFSF